MSITVVCHKCGTENRLGQLFCRSCGGKLDLSQLQPPKAVRDAKSGGPIMRTIRLVVSLGLLLILTLLCWPATPIGQAPAADGASRYQQKSSNLRGAILRKSDVTETFSEEEINAHLNGRLIQPSSGGLLTLEPREIRIALNPTQVTVWLKSALGPLSITYTTTSDIVPREDGRMTLKSGSVKIGQLPLPGALSERPLRQIKTLFNTLQDDLALLNRLLHVEVQDNAVEVATFNPRKAHAEP
ncbi:MAG TPA: zinc ribbon domain-containing protein [Kiritimatiellia bacterium]|nr:zinc ribbon domain-containing protein [Kiritimatiellia bacterium]